MTPYVSVVPLPCLWPACAEAMRGQATATAASYLLAFHGWLVPSPGEQGWEAQPHGTPAPWHPIPRWGPTGTQGVLVEWPR